jgi:anti-sigma B factor antagonist
MSVFACGVLTEGREGAAVTLSVGWRYTLDRSVVLTLRGQLDYAGAPDLRAVISAAAVRDPRPPRIVLDLSGVTVIDRVGVGTLVVGNRICAQVGVELALSNPSPLIRQLLGLPKDQRADGPDVTGPVGETTESGTPGGEWIDVRARAG